MKVRFSDGISQAGARGCPRADAKRLEQVVRRIVLAVLVLDAREDRELPARPDMDLELRHAVDDMVVDPLGVVTVRLLARLPVAFEDVARVAVIRDQLLSGGRAADRGLSALRASSEPV